MFLKIRNLHFLKKMIFWCAIAASPSSCGMLVNKLTTSKDTRSAFSSIVSGRWFRKSRSSRMKLGTCSQRGFKTMSMKLLSRWVGDDGPATIGRSLRSGGACTLMYVEFCWSMAPFTACDLCIFGRLMYFWILTHNPNNPQIINRIKQNLQFLKNSKCLDILFTMYSISPLRHYTCGVRLLLIICVVTYYVVVKYYCK